jgi:hypothetical protein
VVSFWPHVKRQFPIDGSEPEGGLHAGSATCTSGILGNPVGRYSDDTQVRIAVTEFLLKLGGAANAHDDIAIFVAAFQRDPREGYA